MVKEYHLSGCGSRCIEENQSLLAIKPSKDHLASTERHYEPGVGPRGMTAVNQSLPLAESFHCFKHAHKDGFTLGFAVVLKLENAEVMKASGFNERGSGTN